MIKNDINLLEKMRQENNLVYINKIRYDILNYISETDVRLKVRIIKNFITVLFDVIDDYERGDKDFAIRELRKFWDSLND